MDLDTTTRIVNLMIPVCGKIKTEPQKGTLSITISGFLLDAAPAVVLIQTAKAVVHCSMIKRGGGSMSNYKNLKPYNDFNHTAAGFGGVEKYIRSIKSNSFKGGAWKERKKLTWEIPLAVLVWEGGKFVVRKVKEAYAAKKARESEEADQAEKKIKELLTDREEHGRKQDDEAV